MSYKDVFIFWNHGPIPNDARPMFRRPTAFLNMGSPPGRHPDFRGSVLALGHRPIREAIRTKLPGVQPLRIGLLGFSASCSGVRTFLSSADGGYVDTVICIDGIHCQSVSYPAVRGGYLGPYVAFGKLAAYGVPPFSNVVAGNRLLAITNSQADGPPGQDPTSVTTQEITEGILAGYPYISNTLPEVLYHDPSRHPWTNPAGRQRWPDGNVTQWGRHTYEDPPIEWAVNVGGFYALSYRKVDPTSIGDHRYQAAVVLPAVVGALAANRWSIIPPEGGVCMVGA